MTVGAAILVPRPSLVNAVLKECRDKSLQVAERQEPLFVQAAGWGDPAMDFVSLPLRVIDAALAGYRSVMPLDGDDTAEQRILWDKLIGALARLRLPPTPPASPAWPTPTGRLFDLLAAAADGGVSIVRHLH